VKNSRAKRTRIQQTTGKQAVCNLQFFICFPHKNSLLLHGHTKKRKKLGRTEIQRCHKCGYNPAEELHFLSWSQLKSRGNKKIVQT
jgi:hypothetical protein